MIRALLCASQTASKSLSLGTVGALAGLYERSLPVHLLDMNAINGNDECIGCRGCICLPGALCLVEAAVCQAVIYRTQG